MNLDPRFWDDFEFWLPVALAIIFGLFGPQPL